MDAPGIVPCRLSRLCGASVVTARGAVANRTEIPMKLTDTQLVLLCEAAQREGGAIELAPTLKGVAAHRVVGKLLSCHDRQQRRERAALANRAAQPAMLVVLVPHGR